MDMNFTLGDGLNPSRNAHLHREMAVKFIEMAGSLEDIDLTTLSGNELKNKILKLMTYVADLHWHVAEVNESMAKKNTVIIMTTENSIPGEPRSNTKDFNLSEPPFEKDFFSKSVSF